MYSIYTVCTCTSILVVSDLCCEDSLLVLDGGAVSDGPHEHQSTNVFFCVLPEKRGPFIQSRSDLVWGWGHGSGRYHQSRSTDTRVQLFSVKCRQMPRTSGGMNSARPVNSLVKKVWLSFGSDDIALRSSRGAQATPTE